MTELQASAVAALEEYGTYSKAADALGISRDTLRDRVRAARRASQKGETSNPPIPDITKPPEGFIINRHSSALDANGNLLRQWIGTRTDAGEVFEVPAGHVVKGESALVDPDGRVLAKWVKTREGAASNGLIEALQGAFAAYDAKAPVIDAPEYTDDSILTVYPLPDLHFGMYAFGRETGADYDVKIATKLATRGIEDLVSQSRPSKRAIILGLGDYFHANDDKNVTPGSGHKLDVDTRWASVFAAGARLATAIVDIVARKHTEIEIVMLPGNHDADAAICLTVALSLFYSANSRITVYQEPGVTWYHRFGKVLLGATHGHTMKPERMAMMLATDRAEDWGQTKYKHFYFGHIHHESAREYGPVRVESFQSPAAKDAWNAAGGYRAGRSLSAITFHREDGEIGRHRVNVS